MLCTSKSINLSFPSIIMTFTSKCIFMTTFRVSKFKIFSQVPSKLLRGLHAVEFYQKILGIKKISSLFFPDVKDFCVILFSDQRSIE